MSMLSPPQPVRLSKRGSLTPSIRQFLNRYPPAILDDTPPPLSPLPETPSRLPLSSFDRRFPQGYKIADPSIPLHPEEVPSGSERLFSPAYSPICRQLFWWGFLCPFLWIVGASLFILRRIRLNSLIDPKLYWTRVQWLKLNSKYGASCGLAFLVLLLLIVITVIVAKTYLMQ